MSLINENSIVGPQINNESAKTINGIWQYFPQVMKSLILSRVETRKTLPDGL